MRKSIVATALAIAMLTQPAWKAYAEEPSEPEYVKMSTTAYCTGTTTASGKPVREGHAAVNRERMGLTALVYTDEDGHPGHLVGIFECEDTGKGKIMDDGRGAIEAGYCIDIYRETYDRCKEYMVETGGKCWVQFIKAVG